MRHFNHFAITPFFTNIFYANATIFAGGENDDHQQDYNHYTSILFLDINLYLVLTPKKKGNDFSLTTKPARSVGLKFDNLLFKKSFLE